MESETPRSPGVKRDAVKVIHNLAGKFSDSSGETEDFESGRHDAPENDPWGAGVELTAEYLAPAPFPAKIPSIESETLCRRMAAYLHGWCENGIYWILAAEFKRRFARRTGYSWRHIDDVFPQFQSYTTEFVFKRARLGRSWCILIHPKDRKHVLTLREARARLVGAIRSMVSKARGRVGVGRKFLENFQAITGLAPEHVWRAWQSLRRIDGLSTWWSGRKSGRKFYIEPRPLWHTSGARAETEKNSSEGGAGSAGQVSHPENAAGISPLRGNRSENSGCAERSQAGSSSSLRSPPGDGGEETAGAGGAEKRPLRDTPQRPGSAPRGADPTAPTGAHPPGGACKPAGSTRQNYRWKPALPPFLVGDRVMLPARFTRKANFLAFGPMQNFHAEFWRVRFRPTTVPNFAFAALVDGFADWQICAAYRSGLERCHAAAAKDLRAAENLDYWRARERARAGEVGVREPSQAVAVAWQILRGDNLTRDQRWEKLVRGEIVPQKNFPVAPASPAESPTRDRAAPARGEHGRTGGSGGGEGEARPVRQAQGKPCPSYRTIAPGLRVRSPDIASPKPERAAAPDPELLRAMSREELAARQKPACPEPVEGLRTIEQFIKKRGLTMAALFKLPRPEQASILAAARVWQKSGADSK
jgi:hypothetical protein